MGRLPKQSDSLPYPNPQQLDLDTLLLGNKLSDFIGFSCPLLEKQSCQVLTRSEEIMTQAQNVTYQIMNLPFLGVRWKFRG